MNFQRLLLFTVFTFLQHSVLAYKACHPQLTPAKAFKAKICRRQLIRGLAILPITFDLNLGNAFATDKPLTEEEMQEYNKLLKEADRIKNIFEMNINATKQDLGTDKENDLEKYIRENNIKKIKN
jgi:hypothetical protein